MNSYRSKDSRTAFKELIEEERYEHGHGGYSGTIAEKSEFKMVNRKDGEDEDQVVNRYFDTDGHFCDDKWGPAACVDMGVDAQCKPGERLFVFFGYASS